MNMEEALSKVIRNYIMPKYPIIKDFELKFLSKGWVEQTSGVVIIYYVQDENTPDYFTVTEDFAKIEDLTKTLFKMLNDGKHYLRNILFELYKGKK